MSRRFAVRLRPRPPRPGQPLTATRHNKLSSAVNRARCIDRALTEGGREEIVVDVIDNAIPPPAPWIVWSSDGSRVA